MLIFPLFLFEGGHSCTVGGYQLGRGGFWGRRWFSLARDHVHRRRSTVHFHSYVWQLPEMTAAYCRKGEVMEIL